MFKNGTEFQRAIGYFKAFYDESYRAYESSWKQELLDDIAEIVFVYLDSDDYHPGKLTDLVKGKAPLFTGILGFFGIADDLRKYLEAGAENEKKLLEATMDLLEGSARLSDRVDSFKNFMDKQYSEHGIDKKFPLSLMSIFLSANKAHDYSFYRETSYGFAEKDFGFTTATPKGVTDGQRYEYYLEMAQEILDELIKSTGKELCLLDAYNFLYWWQYQHPTFNRTLVEENIARLKSEGQWTKDRVEHRARREAQARKVCEKKIGKLSEAEAADLLVTMDKDFFQGREINQRFGNAFWGCAFSRV